MATFTTLVGAAAEETYISFSAVGASRVKPAFLPKWCYNSAPQWRTNHHCLCTFIVNLTYYKRNRSILFYARQPIREKWPWLLGRLCTCLTDEHWFVLLTHSAPMHMRDGKPELLERCSRRSSSRPVLLRVLVLPFLYSKDPRDQSAEEKSGGIPHLVCTHTQNWG